MVMTSLNLIETDIFDFFFSERNGKPSIETKGMEGVGLLVRGIC